MEEISKFVVENWQWLATAVLCLFTFALQLLKKKPVVRSLIGYCQFLSSSVLPKLINKAEVSGLHGEGKKEYVLKEIMKNLQFMITLDDSSEEEARNFFSAAIEDILSTPRKK